MLVGLIVLTGAAILAGLTETAAEGAEATTVFYVAPNGSDANPGDEAKPFATLARARGAIRQVKAKSGGKVAAPVKVFVRGGKYFLDKTLVFTSDDSGTRESPVVYAAYPGEKPVLSGGRKITAWQPYKDKILQCSVPEAKGGKWRLNQLFCNGKRQVRARWPNTGWLPVEGPAEPGSFAAFKYQAGALPRHWAKPTQGEVFTRMKWGYTNLTPIQKIDEGRRSMTLTSGVCNMGRPPWNDPTHFGHGYGFFFFVENLLEELDQPGEWCLDREEGKVYFWPPEGAIASHEVVAPALDCLVSLRGASWITVSGFTLTETINGGDNMHRFGYEGVGPMFPMADRTYCGEAVHLQGARHCRVAGNRFWEVGGNAVYLEGYNLKNVIQGNEIGYSGHCGIGVMGKREADGEDVLHRPLCNEILDNHIHHCGEFNKVAVGVFCGVSDGTVIGHNRIEEMPHHGVCLGNSGYGRNIVEYNEIRRCTLVAHDSGAVNFWMEDLVVKVDGSPEVIKKEAVRSGHVIRYNRIADTMGFGIYPDNFSANCFIFGNIILRAKCGGLHLNAARNNFIENNIIVSAGNRDLAVSRFWEDNGAVTAYDIARFFWTSTMKGFSVGNRFSRNIMYCTGKGGPDMLIYWTDDSAIDDGANPWIGSSDYNLFYSLGAGRKAIKCGGDRPNVPTIDLTKWKSLGYDEHSLVADPLFVDPEHNDYRLKPESPALKLGFVPIPVEKIGIRAAGAEN